MASQLELMQEAVNRGIPLPPDKQALYDEAVKRGLVNGAATSSGGFLDRATGLAKAAGTGVAQGALALGTMGSEIADFVGRKAAGAMGITPEQIDALNAYKTAAGLGTSPTNAQATEKIESVTGPFYKPKNIGEEYANTLGQFVPGMALGGGSAAQRVIAGTTAALGSETAGQATRAAGMTQAEPYARLAGALIGGMAPAVGRRIVTPYPLSPERRRMVDVLKNEGVDLTAGQTTGSDKLRYMESELGGNAAAKAMETQGEQFTGAALKRAGITASRATPDVMDDAFTRIGNDFNNLAARNNLPPDPRLATDVASVVTDYANLVPSASRAPVIGKLANDMLQAAQSGLQGKQYQSFVSRIGRMSRGTTDPQLKEVLTGIKDSLDDAMERSLQASGSPDLGAWQEARHQYRNLIVLEQAASGAGEKAAEGLISPSQLRNATVTKHGKRAYVRGKGDFADLARAGEATMKPLPQSGTAPRTAARAMGASIPAIIGTLLGSTMGAPTAIVGGVAGAAAPYAMGRALMSGPAKSYLTNQLMAKGGKGLTATQRAIISALGATPRITGPR